MMALVLCSGSICQFSVSRHPMRSGLSNLKSFSWSLISGQAGFSSLRYTLDAARAPPHTDLSDEEISDLWRTVAVIQRALEREHDTSSSTLAIQDGPLAGQTVPHVHVHVLPRRVGDFARNDDVYDDLERWNADGSKALDDDRPPRSAEEMRAEADALRALF